MITCPKCGKPTYSDFFCRGCGTKLMEKCTKCGNLMSAQDAFCGNCGAKNPIYVS